MNSKKELNYQSVTMTEVINFVGISFNVHVHMRVNLLTTDLSGEWLLKESS